MTQEDRWAPKSQHGTFQHRCTLWKGLKFLGYLWASLWAQPCPGQAAMSRAESPAPPALPIGQELLGKHFFKPHHGIHMLSTDGQGPSPTAGDAVAEVTKLHGETQVLGKQRWAPRLTAAEVPAHRASRPHHTLDCSQSTRSRTPLCKVPAQPQTSTRPQLQASCFCSEKALPGACRQASTEKGLHAPYHLPSCPSVQPTLQEQGGPVQTLTVFLLGQSCCCQQAGDRGGHGWPGIPRGEALGGTQDSRVGPGNRVGVVWVQDGGKGLNGGPRSCSC